uniref:Uncharacterized protein n=1 Tax=Strongyloides stercoralis TaxID=6248 RepID=A0A0K0E6C0_STRER
MKYIFILFFFIFIATSVKCFSVDDTRIEYNFKCVDVICEDTCKKDQLKAVCRLEFDNFFADPISSVCECVESLSIEYAKAIKNFFLEKSAEEIEKIYGKK